MPRLGKHVLPVYVEATPEETEARLLKGFARFVLNCREDWGWLIRWQACGGVASCHRSAKYSWYWISSSSGSMARGVKKIPNWSPPFVTAMVSMSRRLCWCGTISGSPPAGSCGTWRSDCSKGENSALVDLFDPRHARKVLTAFGRAYGALPENIGDLSSDQDSFLDQSIAGLAQDGKIISVRLALFAEMVKGKPWTLATLKEVGGTEGIGLTFLEETFSASTAPPEHRLHQKAAQAVLKALLPESGTDIKGQMRSRQELLEASGYANRPRDFDDLIHILDPELRLITPTDPEGSASENQATLRERAILPARARLPGSLPAGLADPQAKGNAARTCGITAGGTFVLVERQTREPPSAVRP